MEYFPVIPSGVQIILFDLDGTLRTSYPGSSQVLLEAAIHRGASDSPEARRRALRWSHYYWAHSPELQADDREFKDDEALFWLNYTRRHLQAFECSPTLVEAIAAEVYSDLREHYHPENRLIAGATETLQQLQQAGYRLGVITNRITSCHSVMEEVGLLQFFEIVVTAGEAGSSKPQAAIFEYALEQINLRPEQALYVGDNYYADIIGARNAGILPILLDMEQIFEEIDCRVIHSLSELCNGHRHLTA